MFLLCVKRSHHAIISRTHMFFSRTLRNYRMHSWNPWNTKHKPGRKALLLCRPWWAWTPLRQAACSALPRWRRWTNPSCLTCGLNEALGDKKSENFNSGNIQRLGWPKKNTKDRPDIIATPKKFRVDSLGEYWQQFLICLLFPYWGFRASCSWQGFSVLWIEL